MECGWKRPILAKPYHVLLMHFFYPHSTEGYFRIKIVLKQQISKPWDMKSE